MTITCPSGQNPVIKWQYSGEEENRIIKANDYSIEREIGKCPVRYRAFGTYVSRRAGDCGKTAYWRSGNDLIGTEVVSYTPILDSSNRHMIQLKS